jgi:hypothetical protein
LIHHASPHVNACERTLATANEAFAPVRRRILVYDKWLTEHAIKLTELIHSPVRAKFAAVFAVTGCFTIIYETGSTFDMLMANW